MKYLSGILFLIICVFFYFIYSGIDRNKADEIEVTPEEIEKDLEEFSAEFEVYFAENQGDMVALDDYYLDIEKDFLFRYEASLEEYIKNKNFQTIEGLIEFIPDNVLVEEIIQDAITNSTSSEEISKLKALKGELDEY